MDHSYFVFPVLWASYESDDGQWRDDFDDVTTDLIFQSALYAGRVRMRRMAAGARAAFY